MLEAASEQKVQHFFFASTDAIYKKYPVDGLNQPIREDLMPRKATGWYALSKVLGEEMCISYFRSQRVPVTIFRFALVFATDEILNFRQFYLNYWQNLYAQRTTGTAAETRKDLFNHQTEKLVVARDKNGRSYQKHVLDVRDLVHAFQSSIGKKQAMGEVFQLAAPEPFAWETTIPYLAQSLELEYIDLCLFDQTPTFYQFNLRKSKEKIAFQPKYDVFNTIDYALNYRSKT
ncbi:hypothetical protein CMK13_17110 [Candidatus Poribacteria bacterium]|nr:hypothetical protein [Candidatus Poribacteria bacterium]OUT55974.1 MAG: hypothetical protein CBB75_16475 [bacterium TMED15]